jgi:hypothetical protein
MICTPIIYKPHQKIELETYPKKINSFISINSEIYSKHCGDPAQNAGARKPRGKRIFGPRAFGYLLGQCQKVTKAHDEHPNNLYSTSKNRIRNLSKENQ